MADAFRALAALGSGPRPDALARRPQLAEAAQAFEALLVRQMLRLADQPLAGERMLDGGSAGRMYRELFHEEVARLAARRGRFGIAALLETRIGERAGDSRAEDEEAS